MGCFTPSQYLLVAISISCIGVSSALANGAGTSATATARVSLIIPQRVTQFKIDSGELNHGINTAGLNVKTNFNGFIQLNSTAIFVSNSSNVIKFREGQTLKLKMYNNQIAMIIPE